MKKTYRIGSSEFVHSPGLLRILLNDHQPKTEEQIQRMDEARQHDYYHQFYRCIYMLGVAFPDMPFKHIEAIAQRQATITQDGETAIIEIEEPDTVPTE